MFYRRLALFIAVVVTGLLALPGRAPAGTVTTRDGKTYVGAVAVNGAEVVVTTEQGRKAFPIASLARASFKSAANEKPPEGYGVRGEYFAGRNFRQLLLTRDDPAIDFKWGDDSIPHPSLSPGGREFSIRWTGRLLAAHSERHQLFANTDDGVRLWVGGKLLIDRWMDQSMAEASAEIDLVAGQEYELKVEYYNGAGPGLAHIAWQSPSMPRQPIPTTSLRLPKSPARPEGILLETPAADGGLPFRRILAPDTVGLRAEYYTDRDLKQLNFIRFDPNIDFHFHPDNLPDPASSPEGSVRWTGFVEVPKDNEYRFHVEAHLRCRLWVDNKLLIDKWDAQGGEFSSEYLTLEGGKKYAFKLEYASPAGFMLCRARWSSKNAGRDVIPSSAFSTPTDSRLAKPVIGLIYPSADTLATAPETLTLFAAGMSPNAPVQKVEFFDKNGLLWANTAQPYRFVWNRPPAGLYNIRAKLTDTLGVTALSDPFQLTVTGKGDGSLKAPWGDFFIANTEYTVRPRRGRTGGGDVVVANAYLTAGSASFNPQTGEFKLDNSVGSLTSDNQPDAGDFVVQPLTGDGQIVARIASLTPRDPNADAMAGITIRENLKSRCKHASLLWGVPANDPVVSFVRRQDHWMNPVQTERNAETPHWVKLVRHGSRVHAYTSPDGKTWDLIGSDRFETGPTVFVGLVAASKDKDRPATAVFDHVEVTTGSPALESSTKGFVTRSGSFVAADVWAIEDDRVRFTRDNKQDSIALADVARVCYRPVLAEHAKRLSPDQPGALMAGGDFLDGDIKALKDGQVSISSVLFGVKKIYLHEDLTAVILRSLDVAAAKAPLTIVTADASTYRATALTAKGATLEIQEPALGTVSLPLTSVTEIRSE